MKNKIMLVIFLFFMIASLFSQEYGYNPSGTSVLGAGVGMAWIDEQPYYVISIQPDISIGRFGVGLGIQLLYDAHSGRIRTKDWNAGYDFFRIVRYFRYQRKGDALYCV
ncbi:hypothetical protein MUP95_00505 [bacterium]|nr:hypothetical protein [bacterium]